jgi:anti-sigma regulatory factor (Ser/Thr protein kinase)
MKCAVRRVFCSVFRFRSGTAGFHRQYTSQTGAPAAFCGQPRQRHVFGLTMTVEVSVHFPARPSGPLRAFPGGREGGLLMTGATVRESVKVAGLVERARVVREFVGAVLGPEHPCRDEAVLLASELFGNSVRYSRSALPGKTVTVTVTAHADAVRVEVTDRSGPGVPELRPVGDEAEGGRGLGIVAGLAARWGWRRRGGRTVTWFVLRA